MSKIIDLVDAFWDWAGASRLHNGLDITQLSVNPFDFPLIFEMQRECATLINQDLSNDEIDAFLTCMAVDNEEEQILHQCRDYADDLFLTRLASCGIRHLQSEARWQIAELLRRNIPNRIAFLEILQSDAHPYVRKRAISVICDILNR